MSNDNIFAHIYNVDSGMVEDSFELILNNSEYPNDTTTFRALIRHTKCGAFNNGVRHKCRECYINIPESILTVWRLMCGDQIRTWKESYFIEEKHSESYS